MPMANMMKATATALLRTTLVMLRVFTVPHAAFHDSSHNGRTTIQHGCRQVNHTAKHTHKAGVAGLPAGVWVTVSVTGVMVHG